MRINNNVMALNAHRQLGMNQAGASKSMEKLSSGFRINRAGDDAAGLAISEKMRGQIRGLKQATRNAQDGISLIQTAEGALNETHAILQRMRELAVQSATDTNEDPDRIEIQEEINQLAEELSRIASDTEFNNQKLLNGNYANKVFHIGANENQNVKLSIGNMDANTLKVAGSGEGVATTDITVASGTVANTPSTGLVAGEQTLDVVKVDNVTVGPAANQVIANYALANDKGEIVAVSQDGQAYRMLTAATKAADLSSATPNLAANATIDFGAGNKVISGQVTLTAAIDGNGKTTGMTAINATNSIDVSGLAAGEYTNVAIGDGNFGDYFGAGKIEIATENPLAHGDIASVLLNEDGDVAAVSFFGTDTEFYAVEDVNFMASDATPGNRITAAKGDADVAMTATLTNGQELKVEANGGIDVSSQAAADKAITIINEAITQVSAERSKLGAMQNRLEHTISNLGTSAENLQAAEARIRDLDMAEEIMAFTKNNILQQAATAMLAQANMAPQSVLQLLG